MAKQLRASEIRSTTGGTLVANLSLATSEQYTDEERTEWHNLVAYARSAEIMGDKNSGTKVYRSEVVVFDITLLNGGSSNGDAHPEKEYRRCVQHLLSQR